MDVLLARADAIIAPAVKYFEDAIEGKRGAQLARMKVARIFNPLHVKSLGSSLLATDIDALSIFRFSKHPELAPEIEAMKSELSTYLNLVKDIKPLTQRRDAKTKKDTFDLQVWWCEAASKIPSWATVLTNSPCLPTRPTPSRRSAASPSSTTPLTTTSRAQTPTTSSSRSRSSITRVAAAVRELSAA